MKSNLISKLWVFSPVELGTSEGKFKWPRQGLSFMWSVHAGTWPAWEQEAAAHFRSWSRNCSDWRAGEARSLTSCAANHNLNLCSSVVKWSIGENQWEKQKNKTKPNRFPSLYFLSATYEHLPGHLSVIPLLIYRCLFPPLVCTPGRVLTFHLH